MLVLLNIQEKKASVVNGLQHCKCNWCVLEKTQPQEKLAQKILILSFRGRGHGRVKREIMN
jgi:hypothetical protein